MRTQGATFVAAALVLVAAAPASAVTGGFGVAEAVQARPLPILAKSAQARKIVGCHTNGQISRGARTVETTAERLGRKAVPVACEQPPRSELPPDVYKQVAAAVLSVLG